VKLAFCIFNYFPFGGLQRDFMCIAKECITRGYEIDVYTMQWQGDQEPGLSVTIVPTQGWQNHTRCRHFASQVKKHLSNKTYDLVVGFNKMPGLDVYYAADTCYQAKAKTQRRFYYRLLPRYRHLVDYEHSVFSPHQNTKILLIAQQQQNEFTHYYKTPNERFHILPPGISKDRMAPDNAAVIRAELRKEFHLSENDFLLLMVGSGFKTKGLDRALIGIAALPTDLKQRCHFFVIGEDNPKPFQALTKKLSVKFLGGRHDVPQFLLAADLLLHPAYNENTGTVLLEALISGLPVLTTDVCGYAHYIASANAGKVMPSPFNQAQFNHVLQAMLLSSEKELWQKNGLAFAKNHDIYSMPTHAVNIIESLGMYRAI